MKIFKLHNQRGKKKKKIVTQDDDKQAAMICLDALEKTANTADLLDILKNVVAAKRFEVAVECCLFHFEKQKFSLERAFKQITSDKRITPCTSHSGFLGSMHAMEC